MAEALGMGMGDELTSTAHNDDSDVRSISAQQEQQGQEAGEDVTSTAPLVSFEDAEPLDPLDVDFFVDATERTNSMSNMSNMSSIRAFGPLAHWSESCVHTLGKSTQEESFGATHVYRIPNIVHFVVADKSERFFDWTMYLAVRAAKDRLKPDVIYMHLIDGIEPYGAWYVYYMK